MLFGGAATALRGRLPQLGPLYHPGATFFPAVAPVAAVLALVVVLVGRDRVQLPIALFQACLVFPVIALIGAGVAHVANEVLDHGPAAAFPYEVQEFGYSRHGPVALLAPTNQASGAPRLNVDVDRVGGKAAARGQLVLVRVRPGAFGYPWIAGYEMPTR